jgi:peptide/nickel transport system substrate-binding protein
MSGWSRRQFLVQAGKAAIGAGVAFSATDLLAACAGPHRQPTAENLTPVKGGTVIEGYAADITAGFNPVVNGSSSLDVGVGSMMFDGLLTYNADGELLPLLASAIPKVSADSLTYTFSLRKDATWSDGKPLTGDDVLFTYNLMFDPGFKDVRSPFRADLQAYIASLAAPDPYTIVFKLKSPYAPFLANHGWHGILPKHVLGPLTPAALNTSPFNAAPTVVSGAFKFGEWVKGDHVTLIRNPSYYRGPAYLDNYVLRPILDPQVLLANLTSGQIDCARVTLNSAYADLKANPRLSVLTFAIPQNVNYWYNLNPSNPASRFLCDRAVRQALAYAADKSGISEGVYFKVGGVAADSVIPSSSWAYSSKVSPKYTFDKSKAAAMLDSAGWKKGATGIREKGGVQMKFEITTLANNPNYGGVAQVLQQAWNELGCAVTIKAVPLAQLTNAAYTSRAFDVLIISLLTGIDPDESSYLHSRNITPGGMNISGYSNPQVDQLLDQAVTTLDQNKRKQLYLEFQNIIATDAPTLPLVVQGGIWAYKKQVHGWGAGVMGAYAWNGLRPYFKDVFVTKS